MSNGDTNNKTGSGNQGTEQPQQTPQPAPAQTTPPAVYERPKPTAMPGELEQRFDSDDD
jgi:hypothetical protein